MHRPAQLTHQLKYVWYFVALFCSVEIINLLSARSLNQFSIFPRDFSSIGYIFSAPFLHANLSHFFSNIITLAIFAFLVMQFSGKRNNSPRTNALRFVKLTLLIIFSTGLLVWIFARPAYHLGASGLLYGYFGYLIFAGWLQKRISLLLLSILVGFLYGGIIWGVLPTQSYISWESHLFGFLSGLFVAWLNRKIK